MRVRATSMNTRNNEKPTHGPFPFNSDVLELILNWVMFPGYTSRYQGIKGPHKEISELVEVNKT